LKKYVFLFFFLFFFLSFLSSIVVRKAIKSWKIGSLSCLCQFFKLWKKVSRKRSTPVVLEDERTERWAHLNLLD
jgi:hypothetical protein